MNVSDLLEAARGLGFFGPQPVAVQIEHARGFAEVLAAEVDGSPLPNGQIRRGLDLGSGGGLPGLVLAETMAEVSWTLLDSMERRMAFVTHAIDSLGWSESRCRAVRARAEEFARLRTERGSYHLVVARGFGPPADAAECAAGLLAPGGLLVVSEPPASDGSRWSVGGLRSLGYGEVDTVVRRGFSFVALHQTGLVPDWCPRPRAKRARRPWLGEPPTEALAADVSRETAPEEAEPVDAPCAPSKGTSKVPRETCGRPDGP